MLYIFYTMSHFLFIWYATVLLREFLIDGGIEATLNVINVITFVLYVLLFIQFFIYATTGTVIFPREFGLRSNSIRIPLSAFGNLMIIYNYWKFRFSKNYSAFNIIQLALGIFLLFFVQQTRAYYIVVLGSILVMELVGKKTKYYVVKNLLIVLCLIAFIGFSSVWENFVDSLSVENETYGVATGARLLAIDYYWDAFLDNPLFAQGFIADVRYTNIMQGPFGIYNYSDVGFIGLLAQTGLFSIVLFIWPVVRWIKIIIRCKRNNIDYSLLLGLLFFSLSSMVSLSLFDSPRAILLPFLLAIFEFYYVQSINKIGDTKIGGVRRIERKI
ncbi:MAG: O-antigen ligase family protein [Oscillospiraceae bacterium]|nr:O-antigen ligase family protein [Oscillospiraceae bacterium]